MVSGPSKDHMRTTIPIVESRVHCGAFAPFIVQPRLWSGGRQLYNRACPKTGGVISHMIFEPTRPPNSVWRHISFRGLNMRTIIFTFIFCGICHTALAAGYTCQTTKTYTSCNNGYYLSNDTCGTCPSQYSESDCNRDSINDCFTRTESLITCKPAGAYSGTGWDYYNNSDIGQSCQGCLYTVSKCKSGYYLSNNTCTQCPSAFPLTDPETAAYSDETTLNDCWRYCNASDVPNSTARTGWREYGGDNTCAATACTTGYYLSNGQCLQCPKGSYCNNSTKYTCPSDYPLTDPRTETYSNETSINDCWRDCNASDVPNSTARTGWREYGGDNTCAATACAAGYYLENGTCKKCPDGYTSANGTTGGIGSCYTSCTRPCTQQPIPTGAYSVTHGTTSTSGTQYYGGTCSAPTSTCSITINTCKTGFYKSNNSCNTCPSDYPLTDTIGNAYSDEISINGCWRHCNASDVPNSTARTGWREYSGNNICAATACAAGYALSSGTCVSCPSGYTSSNGMTNGTSYCYKTCPAKTGYTLTGGVDYYSATDTCTYNPNCNAITINPYCVGMTSSTIYKKTDTAGWFSDSSCTTATTKITPLQSCQDTWGFRGYYSENISDLYADGNPGTQYITKSGTSTTAGTNWTVNAPATIYAAWARNCASISNGTCILNISDTGQVDYITTCNTGFSIDSDNTYNPTCTINTYSCAATQYLNGTTCQSCENGYYCSGGTWTYNGGIQGRNKCPSDYPLTDPQTATYSNETSIDGCWRNCNTSDLPNAATYTGWKEYSGNNTCQILTCANGYALTTTNECALMCTAGITYLHIGSNIKIPLYASQRTTPSIHIKTNNTICYANLATGTNDGLNIKHNNNTYHATN